MIDEKLAHNSRTPARPALRQEDAPRAHVLRLPAGSSCMCVCPTAGCCLGVVASDFGCKTIYPTVVLQTSNCSSLGDLHAMFAGEQHQRPACWRCCGSSPTGIGQPRRYLFAARTTCRHPRMWEDFMRWRIRTPACPRGSTQSSSALQPRLTTHTRTCPRHRLPGRVRHPVSGQRGGVRRGHRGPCGVHKPGLGHDRAVHRSAEPPGPRAVARVRRVAIPNQLYRQRECVCTRAAVLLARRQPPHWLRRPETRQWCDAVLWHARHLLRGGQHTTAPLHPR